MKNQNNLTLLLIGAILIVIGFFMLVSDVRAATPVTQVVNGGTGSTTLTGILKGNLKSSILSAVKDVDYQGPISLTTTGTTGVATFLGDTLNIPNYANTTLITAGTGISTTTSTGGAILVSNTGVLSLQQLGGGTAQTGALTLSTSTQTLNGITYGDRITNSSGAFTFTPNNSGTLTVAGGGTGAATLTGCLTGNGTGAITGSGTCNTTNATVSSVSGSGGTTGLTLTGGPITTTGTLSLGGTLIVGNGGTGQTTFTSGNLIYGVGTGALQSVATTSVSCTGIVSCTSFTAIGGSPITINATGGGSGTVTSISLVGLDGTSPITTTGTITAQVSTSTVPTVGGLAYWTGNTTPSTLGTVATSSETCASGISCTTHVVLIGGGAITLSAIANGNALAFVGSGTGVPVASATSTWFGTGTGGQLLTWANGVPTWVASTTYANGTGISTAFATGQLTITNTGVTSLTAGAGISLSGSTGVITVTNTGSTFAWPFTPSTDNSIVTSATSTALEDTHPGLGMDVANTSWYGEGGVLLAYASTTNEDTVFGLSAGGTSATTSSSVGADTAVGYEAMEARTTPTFADNTAIGALSLVKLTTGGQNTGLGYNSLPAVTTTNGNVGIGYASGLNATGGDNTFIGMAADQSQTSGSFNIAIGQNVNESNLSGSGQLNIGNVIYGIGIYAGGSGSSVPAPASIGIGTTSPSAALDIASSTGQQLALSDGSLTDAHWAFRNAGGTLYIGTSSPATYATNTPSAIQITSQSSTQVGIATTSPWRTLGVAGTIAWSGGTTAAGSVDGVCWNTATDELEINSGASCTVSSKRFKHDIAPIASNDGLDALMQLKPSSFVYNGTKATMYGFVAEDVAAITPSTLGANLVGYDSNGQVNSIDDIGLEAIVVKSVQEQQAEILAIRVGHDAEDNWQWLAIGLLFLWNVWLTFRKHL